MRSAFVILALLAPTPAAAAQRLGYEDVLSPDPRLAYQQVEVTEAPGSAVRAFYGDRFEITPEGNAYSWDVSAEIGGAAHRLWLATAGDGLLGGGLDYVEAQALYSHPILESGLALQLGVRRDFVRPHRTYAVIGAQGNLTAPLYVGAFAYVSTRSELSFRAFAYYDWEPLPRLVLQPYVGAEAASADVPALGVGRGPTELELGLRLRYRIAEPFAPYVGIRYDRLLGRTAGIARQAGDDVGATAFLLGIRSYF
jgi:copper resistance protein B